MFNDLTPTKPVDDMFAETDKTPAMPNGVAMPPLRPVVPPVNPTWSGEKKSPAKKAMKTVFIALLIVVVVLILAYLIYTKLFAVMIKNNEEQANNATSTNKITATSTNPVVNTSSSSTLGTTSSTTIPVILDTDGDGLSDSEEIVLGTNVNLIDTDGDSLTDFDEVKTYLTNPLLKDTDSDELSDDVEIKIYMTDPNKADTDGDGYSDGQEVKGGYNPKGAGKLTQ